MSGPISDPVLIERIYAAVVRRESVFDGRYYTGVHTTGIFCRPSCRSRTPKRENVSFYPSIEAALHAGFRPCKRCKPEAPGSDNPEAALAKAAKAVIEARLPQACSLAELARELHVSSYYLQRVFKRVESCSPAEYTAARRVELAKAMLLAGDMLPVGDIGRRAGFSSPAYFSSVFLKLTGVTPTEFRRAAEQEIL